MSIDKESADLIMYQQLLSELPELLTTETNEASGTILNSLMRSIASVAGDEYQDIINFQDDINVVTATASGVNVWEEFLQLPERPDLTLEARRARLLNRTAGVFPTLDIIKDTIRNYTGDNNFSVYEYFNDGIPASAFLYRVDIIQPASNEFDLEDLQDDLLRIQPAHCGQFVEVAEAWTSLADSVSVSEGPVSISAADFFIIGSSLIGGPDVVS